MTRHVFSIDVEDWYQVSNLEALVGLERWDTCESRLVPAVRRLLEMMEETGTRGTFFILGWNAERHPEMVREIAAGGHEVASHGYNHRLVYSQTPEEFLEDVRRTKGLLEELSGQPVLGYRAASFSIVPRSSWAFEKLAEAGYVYDSSVFPVRHDRYGWPEAPARPFRVPVAGGTLLEFPGSVLNVGGRQLGFAGGGYFRLLPYELVRAGIRRLERDGQGVNTYLHPWEIDPGQPRMPLPAKTRLRCYGNLGRTEGKLRHLLREFRFTSFAELLPEHAGAEVWAPGRGDEEMRRSGNGERIGAATAEREPAAR
jgi:polysaccharide deacetylase family protein (PEP-CTERM system associated)